MAQLFENNASSSLTVLLGISDTSMTVNDGGDFPNPTGGDYFLATLFEYVGGIEANHEIVKCTSRAGDVIGIERAQESTTAREWAIGTRVQLRNTAGTLEKIQDDLQNHTTLAASTAAAGHVELATDAEAIAGTDTSRAVTPAAMAAAMQAAGSVPYGVKWDQSADTYTKGIVIGGVFIPTEYTDYPIHDAHVRCVYNCATGAERLLDPTDSTKYLDGSSADVTGASGDFMVKSPRHYELWTRSGTDIYILVSWSPFEFNGDSAIVPAHYKDAPNYYYDAFEPVWDDAGTIKDHDGVTTLDAGADKCRSLPGFTPVTYQYRSEFRTQYANRGGSSHQWSWSAYQSMVALYITKYADWDSQTQIPGYTDASEWDYAYTRDTGRTMILGNADGSVLVDLSGTDSDLSGIVASGKAIANSFLGIENFFGHVWTWIDGINIDNTSGACTVYVNADEDTFADDTATNYHATGHAPAFGDDDNYVVDILGEGHLCPLYPDNITGGSDSTYLCDYHWEQSGHWRVAACGGTLSHGARAGVVALLCNNASSVRRAVVASRGAARG